MALLKVVIVASLLVFGIVLLLWMQVKSHKRKRCTSNVLFERQYRKIQAKSHSDAPAIVLFMVHRPNVVDSCDRESYNSLAAHCIWSNVVATPYMSHRIVPVILKLDASDSNLGTPSYSFCKYGRHEKCGLYTKLSKVFGRANYMDTLLNMICVHCPTLPESSDGQFTNQMVAMNYAAKHLQDTGVQYSFACLTSTTDCLQFGWDETLVRQLSQAEFNLKDTQLDPILCIPPQQLNKAIQLRAGISKNLEALTQAQVNRNNILLSTTTAQSSHADSLVTAAVDSMGDNLPMSLQLYASLCQEAQTFGLSTEMMDGAEFAKILWHTQLPGLWYGCQQHEHREMFWSVANFDLQQVGNDASPTLTPWWTKGSTIFISRTTVERLVTTFADLVTEEALDYGDFEWSCACISNNFVFATPLSCVVIATIPLMVPSTKRDIAPPSAEFCRLWINQSRVSQVVGISFNLDGAESLVSWVSLDTPLGLVALRHSDFAIQDYALQQSTVAKIKNHDILARFGSYASYFAKRGSK